MQTDFPLLHPYLGQNSRESARIFNERSAFMLLTQRYQLLFLLLCLLYSGGAA